MNEPKTTFNRAQLMALLKELAEELDTAGVSAQLFVVGGAAIALAYNARRTTADVDGVFEPKAVIYEASKRVAARHIGLSSDWLNDGVKGLLPPGGTQHESQVILDLPGLTVSVPSPRYLLALKVQAARIDRDQDDIRFLAKTLGIASADEVLAIAEAVIGPGRLLPKAQFIVQEMFPDAQPKAEAKGRFGWVRKLKPRPAETSLPQSCRGRTQAGRKCILQAGHGGYCRGK
jgi:hypothetical protein